nr:Chain C, Proteinase-activated receptor 1 [Homo sapiens]3BEF_F Chain F, Proteinase-activated receptor 1 [Homo sapiens]
NDKYEPFWE